MNQESPHDKRVRAELKAAGLSSIGLRRFSANYLLSVIHANEHVMAAVAGRNKETEGLFGFVEGMLVATDKRVLYVYHYPGYTTLDEISYDVISGVNLSRTFRTASVKLFSKVGTYTLSHAQPMAARKFVDYIEHEPLQPVMSNRPEAEPAFDLAMKLGPEEFEFLNSHRLGILSSIDSDGNASGAAIYYTVADGSIYFVTKTASRKAAGFLYNKRVALTVTDEPELKTLQLKGAIEAESNRRVVDNVVGKLIVPRHYNSGDKLPPVMRSEGEKFIVYRISPINAILSDYN